jgi:DeoD family purine-nucleoside phosphorylase
MGAESNLAPRAGPAIVTIHLHPTASLADRVLLPGDPGRALLLAQTLLDSPAMFNHHRGLWGYSGTASDGLPLTIQSTGMGGPSAAIVISELAELGARLLVRVGTCGALDEALALGDLVLVTESLSEDGTSRALGDRGALIPDAELAQALTQAAGGDLRAGRVVSTDLFYDTPASELARWIQAGALAVEMESATLLALADRRGLRAASLLAVSDIVKTGAHIADDDLRAAETRLGETAMAALAALGS